MSGQPICFWKLLDVVEQLRLRGRVEEWRDAIVVSQDLRDAESREDVGAARTAIACVTLRRWPVSREIPSQVLGTLTAMGVVVKW